MPAPVPIGSPRKSPPALPPPDPEIIALLDRCGVLDDRYAAEEHWIDERTAVHKKVQDHYQDHPADLPIHAEGDEYIVDLTIRENQQKITDKAKAFASLRKVMGLSKLIEALTYTLKLLDAHIPKEKQAGFVMKERTGPRTLRSARKITPKAA